MDLADLAQILEGVDKDPISCQHPSFLDAAEHVKKLQGLDNDTQLQLYGLYKQSTIGNVNTSKPWSIDIVGTAKWNAWKSYEGFPQESAARTYVYVVAHLLPQVPGSKRSEIRSGKSSSGNGSSSSGCGGSSSSNSEDSIGGSGPSIFDGMGITISTLHASQEQEHNRSAKSWKESEALFAAVVEGCVEKVKALASEPGFDVNFRNDSGMTALHYAVDRGHLALVKILLDHDADTLALDNEDQTPLMIAEICEHTEIVELLNSQSNTVNLTNQETAV